MIHYIGETLVMEFGTGDIGIAIGHIDEDGEGWLPAITFHNQEPKEIGTEGDLDLTKTYPVTAFPVAMTFSNIESLKSVISMLEKMKAEWENEL